jgi:hypothetical protein
MGIKAFAFKTFFGGKPWYKSVTGWSIVVLATAETVVPLVGEMGLADPAQMTVLTSYMEKLAAAMAALGIRRATTNGNGKKLAAVSLVVLLSLGCNSLSVTTQLPDKPPVTIKAQTTGRGCIAAEVNPTTGKIEIVTQQDGTSDWITGRIIPSITGLGIAILTGRGGGDPMQGPDKEKGCNGIFTTVEDDDLDEE